MPAWILARQADPRTAQYPDCASGKLSRLGVPCLTAYVDGV
ncbi:hypothetical protein ACWEOW_17390 [Monashia sp. NPDC004114]